MTLLNGITLVLILAALASVPSTSVALVVTRSATAGFANGAATALGIALGDLVFVALALWGLTAAAAALGGLFIFVRGLAGAYLIWLGVQLWRSACGSATRSRPTPPAPASPRGSASLATSVLTGFLLTLGDVKAIAFYASLLPALVELNQLNNTERALLLAIALVTVAGVKLIYAYTAKRLMALAKRSKRKRPTQVAQAVAGSLMLGTGIYLLAKAP